MCMLWGNTSEWLYTKVNLTHVNNITKVTLALSKRFAPLCHAWKLNKQKERLLNDLELTTLSNNDRHDVSGFINCVQKPKNIEIKLRYAINNDRLRNLITALVLRLLGREDACPWFSDLRTSPYKISCNLWRHW